MCINSLLYLGVYNNIIFISCTVVGWHHSLYNMIQIEYTYQSAILTLLVWKDERSEKNITNYYSTCLVRYVRWTQFKVYKFRRSYLIVFRKYHPYLCFHPNASVHLASSCHNH